VKEELVAGFEVFDGHAHHAVQVLVDIVNLGFELLPEYFLFFGRGNACQWIASSLGNAGSRK